MSKLLTSVFWYSIDHFHSLKDVMKCFKERRNFEFCESSSRFYYTAVVNSYEHQMRFIVEYDQIKKSFDIKLDIGYFGK